MTRTALSSCGENLRQKWRVLWQRMTIAERQQFIESLGAEQIGLGGYVVGRSVEKIAPKMTGIADRDPRP